MVKGFSGFGFPKAHGAAFGLLAYQSTWLRVHYGPEFLCALLNEQPMGFYPPDALVHEAQRRGIEVLRAGRQRERGANARSSAEPGGGRAIGLGYVPGVREHEVERAGRRPRGGGRVPLAVRSRLARRRGRGRRSSCSPGRGRATRWSAATAAASRARIALWQLGVATPGRRVPGGTQLALPLDLPGAAGAARALAWESMLADYGRPG